MDRIDAFLAVLENPSAPPISGHDPIDEVLFSLLAHVAFADGQVGDEEFALLSRLFPQLGSGDLLSQVAASLEQGLDVDWLAHRLPTHPERSKALRFATHMAWADAELDPGESELIRGLVAELRDRPEG